MKSTSARAPRRQHKDICRSIKRVMMIACGTASLLAVAGPAEAGGEAPLPASCKAALRAIDVAQLQRLTKHEYPGVAYLVSVDGKVLHSGSAGSARPESGVAMRPDAIFRLASMTKPIVAAAVLKLVERGQLKLEDHVSRFVPEYADLSVIPPGTTDKQPLQRPITIKDLLTHSSGLEGDPSRFPEIFAAYAKRDTLARQMPVFAQSPLAFQPGARWHYSPVAGFDTLGRIVEVVSGQALDRFLVAEFFQPLRMNDTGFELSAAQQRRVVGLYRWQDAAFVSTPGFIELNKAGYFSAAGGLFGTLDDYWHFAEMLRNDGEYRGRRVLSKAVAAQMHSYQLMSPFPGLERGGWGLGMRVVGTDDPSLPQGAFGWSGAFGTHFWVDPKNRLVAILMLNSTVLGGAGSSVAEDFEKQVRSALDAECVPARRAKARS